MRMSLPHLRIDEEGAGGLSASSLHIGDRFSGTLPNTVWVTGPEGVLPPGVLGTVAVSVLEIEAVFQGRIAAEDIPGPGDDNPNIFIPDGPVSPEHVVVSRDLEAVSSAVCVRGEVIDQAVLIPSHADASVTHNLFKAMGNTVNQAIVVADDDEGWIGGAARVDVDELVMIALQHKDVRIHHRARHVPHGMPALAFQDDVLVERSPHCAVQELCACACEDNTSQRSEWASHDMPIQIQDGPILHCDGMTTTL